MRERASERRRKGVSGLGLLLAHQCVGRVRPDLERTFSAVLALLERSVLMLHVLRVFAVRGEAGSP